MFAYSSVGKGELMFQFEKTINANELYKKKLFAKYT